MFSIYFPTKSFVETFTPYNSKLIFEKQLRISNVVLYTVFDAEQAQINSAEGPGHAKPPLLLFKRPKKTSHIKLPYYHKVLLTIY